MVSAAVSERPLGEGRNQELERDDVLMSVSRWVRLQNSLLRWSAKDEAWHDRVVEERPAWAEDLIDAEAMELRRWGKTPEQSNARRGIA